MNNITKITDNKCLNCKYKNKSIYKGNCDRCLYDIYKTYHHTELENIATKFAVNRKLTELKTKNFFILNIFYNILLKEVKNDSIENWFDIIETKINTSTLKILSTKMTDTERFLFKKEYDYFFGKNSKFQKIENDIKRLGIISISGITTFNTKTEIINPTNTR